MSVTLKKQAKKLDKLKIIDSFEIKKHDLRDKESPEIRLRYNIWKLDTGAVPF